MSRRMNALKESDWKLKVALAADADCQMESSTNQC